MREKRQHICLWVKKVEFSGLWIWLNEPFEIFISDEPIKEGKILAKKALPRLVFTLVSNQTAHTKIVD